jgi:CBS domain-containing protein
MTIARILAAKGRDVVTTQPHRTLAEVAEVLVAKNIGAVVVADVQGSVIGILSERDIIRAVAKRGTAVFNDAVSMYMTAEVITTSEDERVHVAMEKMTNVSLDSRSILLHQRRCQPSFDVGFAISRSSAMRGSSAWCRSATWSSTDSPSTNMNKK